LSNDPAAACSGKEGAYAGGMDLWHYRIWLQHLFEWPRRAEEGKHAEEYAIDDGIWTRCTTGECHIQRALVGQPALSGGHLPPVQQKVTDTLRRENFLGIADEIGRHGGLAEFHDM